MLSVTMLSVTVLSDHSFHSCGNAHWMCAFRAPDSGPWRKWLRKIQMLVPGRNQVGMESGKRGMHEKICSEDY